MFVHSAGAEVALAARNPLFFFYPRGGARQQAALLCHALPPVRASRHAVVVGPPAPSRVSHLCAAGPSSANDAPCTHLCGGRADRPCAAAAADGRAAAPRAAAVALFRVVLRPPAWPAIRHHRAGGGAVVWVDARRAYQRPARHLHLQRVWPQERRGGALQRQRTAPPPLCRPPAPARVRRSPPAA